MPQAKTDLGRLVAIPSIADARQMPTETVLEAADLAAELFAGAGLRDVRRLTSPDGYDAVYGEAPGPAGAPTVLLYCHYDVQPALGEDAWKTPPFELVEREDGRWYGRGAADDKGGLIMHLTALRALEGDFPVTVKLLVEGAEEQGSDGIEHVVRDNVDLLRADALLIGDGGNFAAGVPTLTTSLRGIANLVVRVRTLASPMHSGVYGGKAPDALLALIRMLGTLHDAHGNTTIDGLENDATWSGVAYSEDEFRRDAQVLDGVALVGDGAVADQVWSRLAVNVLGLDVPPVVGAVNAVQAEAAAAVSLRVPPGVDPDRAQQALIAHLEAAAPWGAEVEIEPGVTAPPFAAETGGPAYEAMDRALAQAYGRDATTMGQGGSIPLCNLLQQVMPEAEILLFGPEEPKCMIHAPNESVDPSEIEHMALAEALFLRELATTGGG
jgi:cysteinylglycine-S-conjugate dipeptidase